MNVVQLHEQTLKKVSNPTPIPKIAHQGPKKKKMTPKLIQNQISELEETKKMKVVHLHNETSKQFLIPTSTPKITHQGPKKSRTNPKQPARAPQIKKRYPKSSKNQISKLTKTQKMKVVQLHEQTPKQYLNPSPTPKIARQGPKN